MRQRQGVECRKGGGVWSVQAGLTREEGLSLELGEGTLKCVWPSGGDLICNTKSLSSHEELFGTWVLKTSTYLFFTSSLLSKLPR